MQTATVTVAGRRRVSFTLPEPAATTFIPRDVESPSSRDDAARRSTWPPTRTERYPEGLRKARAPTRSESEPGPTKTCLLDLRGRPRQTSVYGAPRLQNLPCETRFTRPARPPS